MTALEPDEIGRKFLDREGAVPAREATNGFSGASSISVNDGTAHGIPGNCIPRDGDLVDVDVSASRNGYFADTGATLQLEAASRFLGRLC